MEQIFYYFGAELEYMLRMVIAAICGGIIGYERSRRRKEAGLRTHIIVAVGSALLMIVSKYGFVDVLEIPGMRADASRVASNVITGISFLGAGVIFVRDASIKGLTTAAGLWSMAGVGLAIGAGMYAVGIFATVLIMVIQIFTHGNLKKLDGPIYETFSITYENMPHGLEQLKQQLKERNIIIHHIQMEKRDDGSVKVTLDVSREHAITCSDLSDIFADDERIKSFKL
ncbi:MgtC/SapB family protein [Anaerotignum sp.]|nr:MgtC/SapB family protein [Anaerotignum sp.]MBQ7757709.1 MgtC/SapB family protein [Anaerotignum sp.]